MRQGLHPLYAAFYDLLCDALPPEWDPYSGNRSFQEQDKLYAQGRTMRGRIVTDAPGGESAHNYGCATDWTLWENNLPIWIEKEDPRWQIFIDAVTKAGLRPGAEFGDVDHCELKLSVSWTKVFQVFTDEGPGSANEFI